MCLLTKCKHLLFRKKQLLSISMYDLKVRSVVGSVDIHYILLASFNFLHLFVVEAFRILLLLLYWLLVL